MDFNLTPDMLANKAIREAFIRLLYAGGFDRPKAGDSYNGNGGDRQLYTKQLMEAVVDYIGSMRAS